MRPLRAARPLPSAGAAILVHPPPMEEKKKRRSGPSGPSGKHRTPRRLLGDDPDELAAQDAHAAARGESWSEWARAALRETRLRQESRAKKSTGAA